MYFLFRTISSPEDRLSCPQQSHTPHQSFERATGCWLAGRLADWPQTHPPSPVAATLVASLGSPPISRFFGWLVRSTQISGITFTASHRDTQTLTHVHTHTLTQRQPPSSALLGYLLGCCCCSLSSRIFLLLFLLSFTCAISTTTTTCRSLFSNI